MSLKELFENFCEDNDLEFREDYSGRCMYGRTCFGIVCDDIMGTLVRLADYIRDSGDFESASEVLGSPRTDSMGLSSIVYFPSISSED